MEVLRRKESSAQIISEETSKRITSLRFLLIVFVVCIHANLRTNEAIHYYHYEFIQPQWVQMIKDFICVNLGGAAVPLFFFFASFIQFSRNDEYRVVLKKRSKSLLMPYILWTLVTVLLYYISQSVPQLVSYFQNPNNIVKNWNFFDWVNLFAYHTDNAYPLVYQFWFLRDLIIFIIISPLIKFLCDKLSGFFVIFISIIVIKNISAGFTISSSALSFYVAGYYCARYNVHFFKIADKIKMYEYSILFVLEVYFSRMFEGKYDFGSMSTIISCLFFMKLSKIFVQNERIYALLEKLSRVSFFLYAVHAPFLGSAINKITQRIIPLQGILCLVQFLVAVILTVCIGTMIAVFLRKVCLPVFSIMSGGRK